jgi:hypothetical protein
MTVTVQHTSLTCYCLVMFFDNIRNVWRSFFVPTQDDNESSQEQRALVDELEEDTTNLSMRGHTILPPAMPTGGFVCCSSASSLSVDAFVERLLARHTLFPPPNVYRIEEGLGHAFIFSWRTRDGKFLNIEFHSDGLCEWFYCDVSNNVTHAVDVPIDVCKLHPMFWKCIDLVRASIDDYMLEDDHIACVLMFQDICTKFVRTRSLMS